MLYLKPVTDELLQIEKKRPWYLKPDSTPYVAGNTALATAFFGRNIARSLASPDDPLAHIATGLSGGIAVANAYRLGNRFGRTKLASDWEPELPTRDINKVYAVANARQDPNMRKQIDDASKTELTFAERNPDTMHFAGNVIKTIGGLAAAGALGYHALNNATPANLNLEELNLDKPLGQTLAGGMVAAVLGRKIQEPTKRTLADVTDDTYVPTNRDNVRSLLNQSYRMGGKPQESANYTIDVDAAYNKLQQLNATPKVASTESESMPERDYTENIYRSERLQPTTPDRAYSPVKQCMKIASILELDKDSSKEFLNLCFGVPSTLEKVAGASVVAQAAKKPLPLPETMNSFPMKPTDIGDYDVRNDPNLPKSNDKIYYDLLIPQHRR